MFESLKAGEVRCANSWLKHCDLSLSLCLEDHQEKLRLEDAHEKLRLEAAHEKPRLGDARRDGASKFLILRRGRLGDALKVSKNAPPATGDERKNAPPK